MTLFDSANPEQRSEDDSKDMIKLLTEIRDLTQQLVDAQKPQPQDTGDAQPPTGQADQPQAGVEAQNE